MTSISEIVRRFSMLHAVVIGEAMLDRYSIGECRRLSVEAPVPVLDDCVTSSFAGGAANTAINLRSLGARVTFVSTVGNDTEGVMLRSLMKEHGVCVDDIHCTASRQTLSKHRILAGDHMIARFDHGTTTPLDRSSERRLIELLEACVPEADLIVVSDYNYGILTPRIVEHLQRMLRSSAQCVAVDSRRLQTLASLSPTVVKPNYREAAKLLGTNERSDNRVNQVLEWGDDVLKSTAARIAAVTLDVDGAVVFERGRRPHRTITTPCPDRQAAGAGDTYLAAFALAQAGGAKTEFAAELAAAAAAVVVKKRHTAACSANELLLAMAAEHPGNDLAGLALQMDHHRRAGRRIVLTNGCFDILHRGHVTYLQRAKSLGDVLVVGVNSDASIRQLKGQDRPVNCLEDRLGVLAGLSCVDHLVSFEELTPDRIIEVVRPHVFVKGGDYTRETLPEAPLVEALGGRVVILPYLRNHSTTGMMRRIRAGEASPPNPHFNSPKDRESLRVGNEEEVAAGPARTGPLI